jgi:hypothetical protein
MSTCPECFKPTLLYVKAPSKNLELIREALKQKITTVGGQNFEVVEAFPTVRLPTTSTNWPEKIQKLFRGAQEHHRTSDVPEMTISACRSVMEVAIKQLGAEGASFKKKIADLRTRGLITVPIEAWAQKVWKEGNAAIHEIEGTFEEADELIEFLKTFLEVVYDLPASIKEKRDNHESDT